MIAKEPGRRARVRLNAAEPKRYVNLHRRQVRIDVLVGTKVVGATFVRKEVQGKVIVKLCKTKGEFFIDLLYDPLIRVSGNHTIFGEPAIL